jgi:hypothetical protein
MAEGLGVVCEGDGVAPLPGDAPHLAGHPRGVISFSWIESPYDWAVYAQVPPAIPRIPSWRPLNMTWGGLPAAVPPGYIAYFVLPAVTGASMGRWLNSKFR